MTLALLLAYSFAVFAAALVGGWIPRWVTMTHTRTQMMLSLVSGLMLGVAIYHLVPHSVAAVGDIDITMQWLMGGLVFMMLMLRLFHFHQHDFAEGDAGCDGAHADQHDHAHAHDHAHMHPPASPFSWLGLFLGLSIHTLIDGIALGAVMRSEGATGGLLGLGVFLAILLHKPLDAISIETVMAASGWGSRRRSIANWFFAALCPIAAIAFFLGLDMDTGSGLMPAALAFSAGAFICIALGDLLPEVQFHSHDRVKLTLLFLVGIGLAYGIGWLEPAHGAHGH